MGEEDLPTHKLRIARKHLKKDLAAWDQPTDWADLTIYGLYALETSLQAGAEHLGIEWEPTHPSQVRIAKSLRDQHGMPDVEGVLKDLQRGRLYEAYGDIKPSGDFGAEEIAVAVEEFV